MKKSIFAALIVLLVIGLLPIIGNTFIKNTIDTRVTKLKVYGLETKKDEYSATYLHSSRHFEFLLDDPKTFLKYLSQYSGKQIPPYVNAMVNGVLIGVDIEYSNLPFAKAFEIDIYPMSLSQEMSQALQKREEGFARYVEKFVSSKGILYHINYNLLNDDFKGYVKDIQEKYVFKDGVKMNTTLQKLTFKGNGPLLAPVELKSQMKIFSLNLLQKEQELKILFENIKSTSNFASSDTYLTSLDLQHMQILLEGTQEDANITLQNLRVNASSNDQDKTIQLNSKTSIDSVSIASNRVHLAMKKFNFDIALSGLDKKTFIDLKTLMAHNDVAMTPATLTALQRKSIELLSKGMVLDIADFSLKSFTTQKTSKLKGFKTQAKVTLQADKELATKIHISPLLAIADINLLSKSKISKKMFMTLIEKNGFLAALYTYAKEEGDFYLFDIQFQNAQATINGKRLH